MLAAFILTLFFGMETCSLDVFVNAVEGLFESFAFGLGEVVFLYQVTDFVWAFPDVVLLHVLVHSFLELFEDGCIFSVDALVCFML